VRLEHAGAEFTATATVTDNVTLEGMGVELTEMGAKDRAILEKWLNENRGDKANNPSQGASVSR